jgi:hypothetical protein
MREIEGRKLPVVARFLTVFSQALGLAAALALGMALMAGPLWAQTTPEYGDYCEACDAGGDGSDRPRPPLTVVRGPGALVENVVVGPAAEGDVAAAIVRSVGGSVLRSTPLPALGQYSLIATFPSDSARTLALAELARRAPGSGLSLHWIYTFAQQAPGPVAPAAAGPAATPARVPRLYAPELIGDVAPGQCRLSRPVRIGMIDGPVNTDHPALRGALVTHLSLVPRGRVPAAHHGTAVAALMVGEDASGILSGFARGAELVAVSVFALTDEGEETSVDLIVQAIDRLVGQGVQVINMSFAGPDSAALRRTLAATAARGVVMVGAAGNQRARAVAHPAAAPEVIAVTAVDAARRRFRLANVGAENEFSAPGVDVYAARAQGGGYVSGTSLAAPIVTALIAREIARGTTGTDPLRARLRSGAQALGQGGRSAEYGWGLVRAGGC